MEKLDKFIEILKQKEYENFESNRPVLMDDGRIKMLIDPDMHLDSPSGPVPIETRNSRFLLKLGENIMFKAIEIGLDFEEGFSMKRYIIFEFKDFITEIDDETFELFIKLNM